MKWSSSKAAQFRFVDTAGIRRKGKTHMMAEKLSVVMARRHLEAADVALLIIDATEGVTASDATIGGYAHESGRSVIIIVNKWDAVTTGRTDGKPPADRNIFEQQIRRVLKYLDYAPVIFLSALKAKAWARVLKEVKAVAAERRKRVTTGQMNRFLERDRFPARPRSHGQAHPHLLHDPGRRRAAYLRPLHRPRHQAPLRLRALPRKPDPRGLRLRRHAHLVQGEGEKCGRKVLRPYFEGRPKNKT